MEVMRIASGRGKSHLDVTPLIGNLSKNIDYTLTHSEQDLKDLAPQLDVNTMIPWCEFKTGSKINWIGLPTLNCTLFEPVMTDSNVCHSFNPIKTLDFLQPSKYTSSFKKVYATDISDNDSVYMGNGAGENHALNFYLMNLDFRRQGTEYKPPPFYVGISNRKDYLDMESIGQATKPGYHTIRKVQAMEIVPSEDLHSVLINKRKCMFEDETDNLKIFRKYSQSACELECKIIEAAKTCRCYPWFIPAPPDPEYKTICGIHGNYCFQKVMALPHVFKSCSCLPTCHQLEFTYNEQLNRLDPEEMCQEDERIETGMKTIESRIAEMLIMNGQNSLTYKYFTVKDWLAKESNDTMEQWDYQANRIKLCQYLVKNHLAKVSVMFDRKKYVRTMTNLKVTFADKLSTFGKINKTKICAFT